MISEDDGRSLWGKGKGNDGEDWGLEEWQAWEGGQEDGVGRAVGRSRIME